MMKDHTNYKIERGTIWLKLTYNKAVKPYLTKLSIPKFYRTLANFNNYLKLECKTKIYKPSSGSIK